MERVQVMMDGRVDKEMCRYAPREGDTSQGNAPLVALGAAMLIGEVAGLRRRCPPLKPLTSPEGRGPVLQQDTVRPARLLAARLGADRDSFGAAAGDAAPGAWGPVGVTGPAVKRKGDRGSDAGSATEVNAVSSEPATKGTTTLPLTNHMSGAAFKSCVRYVMELSHGVSPLNPAKVM